MVKFKNLLVGGGIALAGIGLYLYLKKEKPPTPPEEEVSANIKEFSITA